MLSGPMEEMRKLRRVAEGKTKMVLFFKDPLASHAHEVDINMLLRVCDVHNVPIAKKKQLLSYYVVIECNHRNFYLHFLVNTTLEPFHELERFFVEIRTINCIYFSEIAHVYYEDSSFNDVLKSHSCLLKNCFHVLHYLFSFCFNRV
jgi:hypothetical protein